MVIGPDAQFDTGNALGMLGVKPLAGRVFTEADAPIGSLPARVAVLTYRFWQRRFAGQSNAIGQTLELDGEPFTVIGVVPAEYSLNLTDLILPLPMNSRSVTWPALVRVRSGVSVAAAEAELQTLFEQFARSRPNSFPRGFRVSLRSLVDEERGASYVPVLTSLFAAAALLLLIGCANVAILLLARGRHRVHEVAVRHALGATRTRLLRMLLCEALLVTLAATVVAVAAARYLLPLLLDLIPGVISISQRASRIAVGPTTILFASSLAAVVAVISGAWPAAAVSRVRGDAIRRSSAAKGSNAGNVGSGVLIAAQVAIVVVLLAGTGVAGRALIDLYRAPAGYDSARVTVAQIYLPTSRYTTWSERVTVYQRLRAEVAREPVVEGSTISLIPTGPPPTTGMLTRIDAQGLRDSTREVLTHSVASDYFATLKMPLVRGRVWSASDDARAEGVTVINQTMARQLWPGEDPIGKRVRDRAFLERRPEWVLNAPGRDGWFEVVGVVRDVPNRGLREPIAPAMYYPYTAALGDVFVLLVRTKGNPIAAEREVRTAVSRADASLPIIRFIPPDAFMGWQQGEFVTAVLLGFGAVALLLASFGLFSVACYSVAHRTREFGIRIALGARPGAIVGSALRSLALAVTAGLGFGLASSAALGSLLGRWSIPSLDDPLVLSGVVVTLLIATVIATLIPARRATTIEPRIALRAE